MSIRTKRVYEPPESGDGYRAPVDRVWPRGLSREQAHLEQWARDLAPSAELRRWFGHDPKRFAGFRSRYRQELKEHRDLLGELRRRVRSGPVTILYAARDEEHNNAVVLAELLKK